MVKKKCVSLVMFGIILSAFTCIAPVALHAAGDTRLQAIDILKDAKADYKPAQKLSQKTPKSVKSKSMRGKPLTHRLREWAGKKCNEAYHAIRSVNKVTAGVTTLVALGGGAILAAQLRRPSSDKSLENNTLLRLKYDGDNQGGLQPFPLPYRRGIGYSMEQHAATSSKWGNAESVAREQYVTEYAESLRMGGNNGEEAWSALIKDCSSKNTWSDAAAAMIVYRNKLQNRDAQNEGGRREVIAQAGSEQGFVEAEQEQRGREIWARAHQLELVENKDEWPGIQSMRDRKDDLYDWFWRALEQPDAQGYERILQGACVDRYREVDPDEERKRQGEGEFGCGQASDENGDDEDENGDGEGENGDGEGEKKRVREGELIVAVTPINNKGAAQDGLNNVVMRGQAAGEDTVVPDRMNSHKPELRGVETPRPVSGLTPAPTGGAHVDTAATIIIQQRQSKVALQQSWNGVGPHSKLQKWRNIYAKVLGANNLLFGEVNTCNDQSKTINNLLYTLHGLLDDQDRAAALSVRAELNRQWLHFITEGKELADFQGLYEQYLEQIRNLSDKKAAVVRQNTVAGVVMDCRQAREGAGSTRQSAVMPQPDQEAGPHCQQLEQWRTRYKSYLQQRSLLFDEVNAHSDQSQVINNQLYTLFGFLDNRDSEGASTIRAALENTWRCLMRQGADLPAFKESYTRYLRQINSLPDEKGAAEGRQVRTWVGRQVQPAGNGPANGQGASASGKKFELTKCQELRFEQANCHGYFIDTKPRSEEELAIPRFAGWLATPCLNRDDMHKACIEQVNRAFTVYKEQGKIFIEISKEGLVLDNRGNVNKWIADLFRMCSSKENSEQAVQDIKREWKQYIKEKRTDQDFELLFNKLLAQAKALPDKAKKNGAAQPNVAKQVGAVEQPDAQQEARQEQAAVVAVVAQEARDPVHGEEDQKEHAGAVDPDNTSPQLTECQKLRWQNALENEWVRIGGGPRTKRILLENQKFAWLATDCQGGDHRQCLEQVRHHFVKKTLSRERHTVQNEAEQKERAAVEHAADARNEGQQEGAREGMPIEERGPAQPAGNERADGPEVGAPDKEFKLTECQLLRLERATKIHKFYDVIEKPHSKKDLEKPRFAKLLGTPCLDKNDEHKSCLQQIDDAFSRESIKKSLLSGGLITRNKPCVNNWIAELLRVCDSKENAGEMVEWIKKQWKQYIENNSTPENFRSLYGQLSKQVQALPDKAKQDSANGVSVVDQLDGERGVPLNNGAAVPENHDKDVDVKEASDAAAQQVVDLTKYQLLAWQEAIDFGFLSPHHKPPSTVKDLQKRPWLVSLANEQDKEERLKVIRQEFKKGMDPKRRYQSRLRKFGNDLTFKQLINLRQVYEEQNFHVAHLWDLASRRENGESIKAEIIAEWTKCIQENVSVEAFKAVYEKFRDRMIEIDNKLKQS